MVYGLYFVCLVVCRYLKLQNGLKALLISDSTTEKASAALSVRIGELSNWKLSE